MDLAVGRAQPGQVLGISQGNRGKGVAGHPLFESASGGLEGGRQASRAATKANRRAWNGHPGFFAPAEKCPDRPQHTVQAYRRNGCGMNFAGTEGEFMKTEREIVIIQQSSAYATQSAHPLTANSQANRQAASGIAATIADTGTDTVSISPAAWAALGVSSAGTTSSSESRAANTVDARLTEIKSKDALSRTAADTEYLWANDKKLAEISAKGKSPEQLTSSELDYMQKAVGFVNTMANLSTAEKALYDKAVASGNSQAAAGLAQIALIRTGGHMAGGANGTTYDPIDTAITAANVGKYFSHSIIDPSGNAGKNFQALIGFLQNNPTTS